MLHAIIRLSERLQIWHINLICANEIEKSSGVVAPVFQGLMFLVLKATAHSLCL